MFSRAAGRLPGARMARWGFSAASSMRTAGVRWASRAEGDAWEARSRRWSMGLFAGFAFAGAATLVHAHAAEVEDTDAELSDPETHGADVNDADEFNVPIRLFTGTSNVELAHRVASELGIELGESNVSRFADGEIQVQLGESVRGGDIYVIQSTCQPVNDSIMELLFMISALRRASAHRITAIVPYYGYKRDVGSPWQGHSTRRRGASPSNAIPIAAADVAVMLESMGVDRVVAVDIQPPGHGQVEGFFATHVMVDNIETTGLAVDYFADKLKCDGSSGESTGLVVVSPNEACVKKARDVQVGICSRLFPDQPGALDTKVSLAAIVHGGLSRGMDRYFYDPSSNVELVGDVQGKDVILVDDMIDTGATLVSRVRMLRDNGAKRIFAFATHGVLSGKACEMLERSVLEEVVVTDTVPLPTGGATCTKVKQLSVAPLLAAVVRRLHDEESIEEFRAFSNEDEPRYATQE
mmetsp:Transcript_25832/g.83103  ORF Transcript_25832/g.83103 Transcript_25832/m.83103 type:complete len:468 (+) Transcript_25832:43-1446(+)